MAEMPMVRIKLEPESVNHLIAQRDEAVRVIRLLAPCLSGFPNGIGDQEREALAAAKPYLPE
jgi:hypothetical protein